MRKINYLIICLICHSFANAQDFSPMAAPFALPQGGLDANSFNALSSALAGSNNGSQMWTTLDMNGDAKPDLVVYQELENGQGGVPGLPNTPHWKVFLNTGDGFSSTATAWKLPAGGLDNQSFNSLSNETPGSNNGSQLWTTLDMNGDNKPDLVAYQELDAGVLGVIGVPNVPYWKVFLNTGDGFASTATAWKLPPGGLDNQSFNSLSNETPGSNNGSHLWTTLDMNGDNKPDLVAYQELDAGVLGVLGVPNVPYWKVFLNTGDGFDQKATGWKLPAGGLDNQSFNSLSNETPGSNNGSQLWTTLDMNGDNKPDLVAYQELDAGVLGVIGVPNVPYWKVFLNTGDGFASSATAWKLPAGGLDNQSFNSLSNETPGSNNGSQLWTTLDMNGDNKPDLVAYQELDVGVMGVLGLPNVPYWKVFLNTPAMNAIEKNATQSNKIKVFPNPTYGKFIIETTPNLQGNIAIFNMMGIKVFNSTIVDQKLTIDLSELPKGTYYIKFHNQQITNNQIITLL
jgi:hypothetical protein